MSSITQYILSRGVSEEVFILIFSIPIIFILITLASRVIGSNTLGTYNVLFFTALLVLFGFEQTIFLFLLIFVSMSIIFFSLKKLSLLRLADSRILDAFILTLMFIVIVLSFLFLPFFERMQLNALTLVSVIILSYYSKNLIKIWKLKKFKQFILPAFESLLLVFLSYFLITLPFIESLIFGYPLTSVIAFAIVALLLAGRRGLRLKEYITYKDVIKHVELSEKK